MSLKKERQTNASRAQTPRSCFCTSSRQETRQALCLQLIKQWRNVFACTGRGGAYSFEVSACVFCTMATGTLHFPKLLYGYFIVFWFSSNLVFCQQFSIAFSRPSDCGVQNYFDISSLTCVKCGPNQVSSKSGNAG